MRLLGEGFDAEGQGGEDWGKWGYDDAGEER